MKNPKKRVTYKAAEKPLLSISFFYDRHRTLMCQLNTHVKTGDELHDHSGDMWLFGGYIMGCELFDEKDRATLRSLGASLVDRYDERKAIREAKGLDYED